MSLFPYRSSRKGADSSIIIPRYRSSIQRKLTLKHVHGPKTWMMDYMQINEIKILNAIHCNSRYWIPLIVKNQNAKNVQTMVNLINSISFINWDLNVIDTVITDAAKCFTTDRSFIAMCEALNIKRITYNMDKGGIRIDSTNPTFPTTSQPHNQLAIIDRISRTLRDMIYNIQLKNPEFELNSKSLNEIAKIYNKTPHDTLTKTMHFNVSPEQALQNKTLQDEIVRRWMKYNYDLVESPEFEYVELGQIVWVYQPSSTFQKRRNTVRDIPYVVIKRNKGNYTLRPINEETEVNDIIAQRKDFILSH